MLTDRQMTSTVEHGDLFDRVTYEITAKDADAFQESAHLIQPNTPVSITFLPNEPLPARIATARVVREAGFDPMPHFAARRLQSHAEFEDGLNQMVEAAAIKRCFVIAGDLDVPAGPFVDSLSLIATGAFSRAGIETVGVGGHPEGHANMTKSQCFDVLQEKFSEIAGQGMRSVIVTQFGFDADPPVAWLEELRGRGIDAPVQLGIPGPAGIRTLLRFAARCGVGASASVMAKYGVSLGRLIGNAGPDRLLNDLHHKIRDIHGAVGLHMYPFGGIKKTAAWVNQFLLERP